MNKKLLLACLSFGLIAVIAVILLKVISSPTTPVTTSPNTPTTTPTTTYEERICVELSKQFGDCNKIIFIDVSSNLVFYENDLGVMPVLTNKEFTKIKAAFHTLDFVEYKEENAPISWQADSDPKEKFSMISGFANNDAKIILINSEDDIQPNRILIRDNLWFWYFTFNKTKLTMPIKVTAFDAKGHIIFGEDE